MHSSTRGNGVGRFATAMTVLQARACALPVAIFSLVALATLTVGQKEARGGEQYAVLPLVFDPDNGYPLVSVEVQGTSIPVSFDLGGSKLKLALSPATLRRHNINVQYTGRSKSGVDARGVRTTAREFALSMIKLGELAGNDVRGVEYHAWGGKGVPRNGIVGFDLISTFNVIIDFPGAKVVLMAGNDRPRVYDLDTWPRVPFTVNGHMITLARIGDKSVSLLWDTGTPLSSLKVGLP